MTCRRREDEENRRSFALETPHFFKIVLSQTVQTRRLGIPKRFVRKYGKNLPKTVCLRVPNGGSWRVELEKWDDMVYLSRGWKEVMKHYSICEGHFLVFKYHFEIDYPLMNAESKNLATVEFVPPRIGDADDHFNLSVGLQSLDDFSLKRKDTAMPASHGSKHSRVTKALKAANKHETQYPSFKVVVRSNTLLKQNVKGDVCVFELVRIDNIELKFSTFRRNVET
ncbi:hypothetical protein BT93_H2633 [Corymbia citriodora subsp. variegata]|nr:hypothetical protein BT93_H2633 [Corymbia citriodora subsp. variegata]